MQKKMFAADVMNKFSTLVARGKEPDWPTW